MLLPILFNDCMCKFDAVWLTVLCISLQLVVGCVCCVQHSCDAQAMGFSKSKAKEALQETDNNLDAAIEWLVANCI